MPSIGTDTSRGASPAADTGDTAAQDDAGAGQGVLSPPGGQRPGCSRGRRKARLGRRAGQARVTSARPWTAGRNVPPPTRPGWPGTGPADRHNVGVACGPSGLVVVDLDSAAHGELPEDRRPMPGVCDGRDVLALLCEWAGHRWPITYAVETPSGGLHLYFRALAGQVLRNTAGKLGPLIDTRARGGYVVRATRSWTAGHMRRSTAASRSRCRDGSASSLPPIPGPGHRWPPGFPRRKPAPWPHCAGWLPRHRRASATSGSTGQPAALPRPPGPARLTRRSSPRPWSPRQPAPGCPRPRPAGRSPPRCRAVTGSAGPPTPEEARQAAERAGQAGKAVPIPACHPAMFRGVLGEIAAAADPGTEADKVGVFASLSSRRPAPSSVTVPTSRSATPGTRCSSGRS